MLLNKMSWYNNLNYITLQNQLNSLHKKQKHTAMDEIKYK